MIWKNTWGVGGWLWEGNLWWTDFSSIRTRTSSTALLRTFTNHLQLLTVGDSANGNSSSEEHETQKAELSSRLQHSLFQKCIFMWERAIGLVVSTLHLGPKVQGQALKRSLCSWTGHRTLTMPFSTHPSKWVLANC